MNPVLPLPGPLDSWPRVPHTVAVEQLRAALDGLPLGTVDRQLIDWLSCWNSPAIAGFASLLRRSWEAGLTTGRTELAEETPAPQNSPEGDL